MNNPKNFTVRLKATIEKKMLAAGLLKHGVFPPDDFEKKDTEKMKLWNFFESLEEVNISDLDKDGHKNTNQDIKAKREHFAGLAMQAILSTDSNEISWMDAEKVAIKSVEYADALLKELDK